MKFHLLITLNLITIISSIKIDCNFFTDTRKSYGCEVISLEIQSNDNRIIDEVTGDQLNNKSTSQVTYFASQHKTVKFFPVNLELFFASLETISIYNASLMEIDKNDLKPFGSLKKLMLYHNLIEIIEADLFEFTPNLILLCLQFNKIKTVESGAFGGLNNLVLLHFHNPCFSGDGFNRRVVLELLDRIYGECDGSVEEDNLELKNCREEVTSLSVKLKDLMEKNQG